MDDLDVIECLYANTEEDHRQNRFTCAFHEHQTINGESIGSAATKSRLLGCDIYSRLLEGPNIYGTTCVA
ncbi:hypothetical protein GQ600_10409 [Phytophthora cactorum]|nr:hypothetical protein GQ600_10409 [Phytophthora cactorum]